MKRSVVNQIIRENIEFINKMNFKLPPFAFWTPEEWAEKGHEYDEIRDNMLGWDVTDFGSGDYEKVGLFLFTIRNGNIHNPKYNKTYAEKLLISGEGQVTPYHFHWHKAEDIINRGGGNLVVKLYNSTEDGKFADTPVTVNVDGHEYEIEAGGLVVLKPGESITMQRGQYHSFWGEPGSGKVLVGEVSMVNDDNADNRFYEPAGRFPEIEEDEPVLHYLCSEYPKAK